MELHVYLAFIVATAIMIALPGPSVLLTVAQSGFSTLARSQYGRDRERIKGLNKFSFQLSGDMSL